MGGETLTVDQAEQYLKAMLDRADVSPDHFDAYKAWQTFKEFSRIRVDCADDGLLFEVLPGPESSVFTLHFVRQFSVSFEVGICTKCRP